MYEPHIVKLLLEVMRKPECNQCFPSLSPERFFKIYFTPSILHLFFPLVPRWSPCSPRRHYLHPSHWSGRSMKMGTTSVSCASVSPVPSTLPTTCPRLMGGNLSRGFPRARGDPWEARKSSNKHDTEDSSDIHDHRGWDHYFAGFTYSLLFKTTQ